MQATLSKGKVEDGKNESELCLFLERRLLGRCTSKGDGKRKVTRRTSGQKVVCAPSAYGVPRWEALIRTTYIIRCSSWVLPELWALTSGG